MCILCAPKSGLFKYLLIGVFMCFIIGVCLCVSIWVFICAPKWVYLNILTLFFYKCVCSRQTQEPVTLLSFMEGE